MNALDPRIVHIWRLLGAAVALVLTLLAGLIEFTELRPGALDPIRPGTLTVAVAVVAFGIAILYPPLRYRFWRWSVEADRVVIQKGVIWRTRSLFPRVRIQHVDTRTSPLQRGFGLSSLIVYTAGTRGADAAIPGLDADRAERLREELARLEDLDVPRGAGPATGHADARLRGPGPDAR